LLDFQLVLLHRDRDMATEEKVVRLHGGLDVLFTSESTLSEVLVPVTTIGLREDRSCGCARPAQMEKAQPAPTAMKMCFTCWFMGLVSVYLQFPASR
jgi:hypothetical protein